jgi:hypothetical protein
VLVNGQSVTLVGLPALMQQFKESGKELSDETIRGLLEQVKIYNPVRAGDEPSYYETLQKEYEAYLAKEP